MRFKSELQDLVADLLKKYPHLRDNDQRLCCMVWVREIRKMNLDYTDMSAHHLMSMYVDGQISNPDTITRIRRKAQEKNVHLRGEKYKKRQGLQNNVKQQLGYDT